MHVQNESGNQAERYLLRLRIALGKTPEEEKNEIVSDIRCHISERIAESGLPEDATVTQILASLGSPESLAETYRAAGLMDRAAAAFNPWLLLRATFVWALSATRGLFALLAVFTGYLTALIFLACAVLKPIFPHHIGMWVDPPVFTFGILQPSPSPAGELLGYWIIPVSIVLAVSTFVFTTRLAKWLVRRFSTRVFFVSDMSKSDKDLLRQTIRECMMRMRERRLQS